MEQSQNQKELLKEAVETVINDKKNDQEVHKRLMQIHGIFSDLTKISGMDQEMELMAAIPTAYGMALGLNHAAQCLLDQRRTVKLLDGMLKAIRKVQEDKKDGPVQIFYAGCGPYAPFLSMIAPLFSEKEIRFTLLEINERSLDTAKSLVKALELETYVADYLQADATSHQIENAQKIDILFSETLDAVLYRECYVPILINLIPQLREDAIVIPENVRLELRFIHKGEADAPREESHKATLIDVRQMVDRFKNSEQLPENLLNFPVDLVGMEDYESLLIDTWVLIYDDIQLQRGESSLTLPLELKLEHPFPNSRMTFNYMLRPQIELKYNLEELA